MLIGRSLLILLMRSTFIIAALTITTTTLTSPHQQQDSIQSSTLASTHPRTQWKSLLIVSDPPVTAAAHPNECQHPCEIDHCLQHLYLNKNCTKLIRDQCDCCTVCLRTEHETCGGYLNVYGLCEQDLLCYASNRTTVNLTDRTGICVKACLQYQCLPVIVNNRSTCQCANRRAPCDWNLRANSTETNATHHLCDPQVASPQPPGELSLLKANDVPEIINCSSVVCPADATNLLICPPDSHFVEDHTTALRSSLSSTKNLSAICCEPRGHCVCSSCSKTICGENSIIQIYRTGNPNLPGQCCDQFNCIKNSKQCHHDKKIYSENETWSIDHCTTCTCRAGLVDCLMVQCPTYTHCGYMYKPENECCPKCGGCLNDRLHVQHMNSTWIESNGCMRCWCENGRSRCFAEGCIAPPCENPRQVANVCCPVCDYSDAVDSSPAKMDPSRSKTDLCPPLDKCSLVCEYGLARDEQGCLECTCASMSCPAPLCTFKVDRSSKSYCSCLSPLGLRCAPFTCDKHCPYSYAIDTETGCPQCQCNPCPTLVCTKNCTFGLKRNEVGCPICVCESAQKNQATTISTEVFTQSWPRQCQSGLFSYSNGEIWFDGCRQCLCHKGEQLCALISCPTPKCAQPIILPNRCCPSCPDALIVPEPIPSSQVCYASQYVTGEELEFDKCTKCLCLHNIAFCSVSLCPPLRCSSPVYDASLCCPICPPATERLPSKAVSRIDSDDDENDICLLDNGMIKHPGELWKQDECRSCLCPRGGNGRSECFSQTCDLNLSCSNPVLKKGQCCPFCLPPTAAVAVCIFNYVQYRSGEYWNVSECHRCECSLGTIVCHQHQCPALSCVHTVTLSGHCCPICRDQLPLFIDQNKPIISPSRFGLTIIIAFSILILLLIVVIIILIFILLRGAHRSLASTTDHLPTNHHRSPIISPHPTVTSSKPSTIYSYVKYDLISISNGTTPSKQGGLSSSGHIPLTSLEQTSTHSMMGTNTITTGTGSSNHELEPGAWTEDDVMLPCNTSSSNGGDDDDDDVGIMSSDNEESHQSQASHSQMQMITGPPTIIYV